MQWYRTEADLLAAVARMNGMHDTLETKALPTRPTVGQVATRKPSAFQQFMVRLDKRLVALERRIAQLEPRPTKALHHTPPGPIERVR